MEQLQNEIPKIIFHDTEITDEKTPGFIIGIIDGDSTYIIPFGTSEKEGNTDISVDDRFCLGGNTKVFTGLLVRILEGKGLLSVNEKLNDLLPDSYANEYFSEVTIAHLLSHHSGLPKIPSGIGRREVNGNLYSAYSKRDLLDFYKNFIPLSEEIPHYKYSHLNYGLLEIGLEEKLKMPFEEIMHAYLIDPMGLGTLDLMKFDDKIATGYNLSMLIAIPTPYASNNGALGMVGSMNDLLKFLRNLLSADRYLTESINRSMQPILGATYTPYMHMASGWQIMEIKRKRNLYFHNGKAMGHHSFLALYPSTKTSVVILANSEYGTHDLGLLIMRMLNRNWKRKK